MANSYKGSNGTTISNSTVESQPNKAPKKNNDISEKKYTKKTTKSSSKKTERKNIDSPQESFIGPKDFQKSVDKKNYGSEVPVPKTKILQDKNSLFGIEKERPFILMSTDYRPVYQDNGSITNDGFYLKNQQNIRNLRLDIMEKIFSNIKSDENILIKLRNYFDQGIDYVSEQIDVIFEVVNNMQLLKDKMDLRDVAYNKDGKIDGKNIIVSILEKVGYQTSSLEKEYTSTKLWMQFLAEMKRAFLYSSFTEFNFSGEKINDANPTNLYLINDGYYLNIDNAGTDKIKEFVKLPLDDAQLKISNFIYDSKTPNDLERWLSSKISSISKNNRYKKSLKDEGIVNFLTKKYGFQNSTNVNFVNIFDAAIGKFPSDIFEMPDGNSNSLLSLSQFQNYVLTFENSSYISNDKKGGQQLFTPGGVYYVDSLLNGNIDTYTSNITKLSSTIRQTIENFNKLTNYFFPVAASDDSSAGYDLLDYPLDIYDIFTSTFVEEDEKSIKLKEIFINDPFIVLIGHITIMSPGTDILLKRLLVQFLLYCVTDKKDNAKKILDSIFTLMFGSISIKWGGDNVVDQVPIQETDKDGNVTFKNDVDSKNKTWWELMKTSNPNSYWMSGDVLYDSIYGLIDGSGSEAGKKVIEIMKSFTANSVGLPVGTQLMSEVNTFCGLCDILIIFLNKIAGAYFVSFYTKSNLSFGSLNTTYDMASTTTTKTSWGGLRKDTETNNYVNKTSIGAAQNVETLAEVDEAKKDFIKAQFNSGDGRNTINEFEIEIHHKPSDKKMFVNSVKNNIKKEKDFITEFIETSTGVLNIINESIDDLLKSIQSTRFQFLLNRLYFLNQFPPVGEKSNDSTITPEGLQIVGTTLQDLTSYNSNASQVSYNPGGGGIVNQLGATGGGGTGAANQLGATGVAGLAGGINLDLSFFTKKQISLIASSVMDIKTKIANDSKIKSKVYIYPFDDILYTKKLSDTFFNFFKVFGNDPSSRYKLFSIGIPNGFSDKLKYKLSTINKNNLKQNDVINIDIYKIDVLNPDIIYKPISFLFETSRFVVRDSFYLNSIIDGNLSNSSSLLKFINGFPTRNFENLTTQEMDKIDYYPDFSNNSGYSFLSENQKRKLYYNHAVSYMLEIYIKAMTGISMSEAEFYSKRTSYYVNDGVVSQIKTILDSQVESQNNPETKKEINEIIVDEWKRNMTSISDPVAVSNNVFMSKKVERIFNVLVEPHKFEIDFQKTISNEQGKKAFEYLFAKDFVKLNDSGEYIAQLPTKSVVTMDRFFVQIKTMNNEVI